MSSTIQSNEKTIEELELQVKNWELIVSLSNNNDEFNSDDYMSRGTKLELKHNVTL